MRVGTSIALRVWWGLGLGAVLGLVSCGGQPAGKGPGPLLVADPPLGEGTTAPGAGVADFDRGVALVTKGAFADAIGYFDRALAVKPDNAAAEYYRAVARDRTGDRVGAEQGYVRALELDPKLLDAAINLGALYLDDGGGKSKPQPDKAIAVLSKAAEQAPVEDQADIRSNLAFAYRLTKDYDKSAAQYRKALERGEQPGLRFALGDMLVEADKCTEAKAELLKAAEGLREDTAQLGKIADTLGRCKAFAECIQVLDAAVQREPTKPDWYTRRGVCRHAGGDEPKARADYEEAIKRDAKFAPAYYYLGMSYRADKQRLNASKALEKALEVDRDGPWGARAKEALAKDKSGKK